MVESMLHSPFFGLVLTAGAWSLGCWLQKKTGWVLCNPLLLSGVAIIALLTILKIPLECYELGGDMIKLMLAPVTAVLALNIYRQRRILKEYFIPVLAGCLTGSIASLGLVVLLCRVFRVDDAMLASLLPKSVTTAIAIGIAESRSGIGGIAATAVVLAGIVGAVFAPVFAKMFHITDPVAQGVATGACSHALGTTKAMEMGEIQGAMSSISLCVCGIFTSILVLFL